MSDPRDESTGWDDGWENAVDEGEGISEFLMSGGDTEFSSMRGYHKDQLNYPHLGKNEPEDPYLQ